MQKQNVWVVVIVMLIVVPVSRAEPTAARDTSFRRFFKKNEQMQTSQGTLKQVYNNAIKNHVVMRLKNEGINVGLILGFRGGYRLKKLRPLLKMVGRGFRAKWAGNIAYDVGARKSMKRSHSLGENAMSAAYLAACMIPRARLLMPKLFVAGMCQMAYNGAKKIGEGIMLARGEALSAAKAARSQELDPHLFNQYRGDLQELQQKHQDKKDQAISKIKEHRGLWTQAMLEFKRNEGIVDTAPALARKTWHEDVLHRSLNAARGQKKAIHRIQDVLDKMDRATLGAGAGATN